MSFLFLCFSLTCSPEPSATVHFLWFAQFQAFDRTWKVSNPMHLCDPLARPPSPTPHIWSLDGIMPVESSCIFQILITLLRCSVVSLGCFLGFANCCSICRLVRLCRAFDSLQAALSYKRMHKLAPSTLIDALSCRGAPFRKRKWRLRHAPCSPPSPPAPPPGGHPHTPSIHFPSKPQLSQYSASPCSCPYLISKAELLFSVVQQPLPVCI